MPAQNLRELVEYIKKNPDKANAGGSTAGHQLMTALFREKTGAPVQYIPYKGMNEVSAALAGDQLMMSFLTAANAGQINSGAVRALAVTSATRDARFPNVPTTAEAGVEGFIALSWAGFLAPARTPAAIVNKLSSEIAAAVKLPEVRDKLLAANLDPVGNNSEQFAQHDRRRLQGLGCGREGRQHPDQPVDCAASPRTMRLKTARHRMRLVDGVAQSARRESVPDDADVGNSGTAQLGDTAVIRYLRPDADDESTFSMRISRPLA